MDREHRRSTDVTTTILTVPVTASRERSALDFEALYRSSRDDVFAYVATLLRDRSAAEDVTAAAFERAFRKRRSFRSDRGSPRGWLFGIARNAALDELRRRKRRTALEGEPLDAAAPTADEHAEQALRRETVRAALATLAPHERDLVALKFSGGLSHAEIARVIGASESNAGTRLHRVVEKLRKACDVDA
jgi:RNA polymerase sigma-70 factor (ECF subfamily)